MILTVTNIKGGTGKSTSCAYLAHALHEQGRRVLVLDSDPQRSLIRWADLAGGWPFPVEPWQPGAATRWDGDVVIDTPPTDHARGTVERAVAEASHVLVPVAPSPLEYERTASLRALIDDVRRQRAVVAALLVRTVAGAASTAIYRELLDEDGWRVLRATVGRLERFGQAFGAPVERASATAYGDALAELRPSPKPRTVEVQA